MIRVNGVWKKILVPTSSAPEVQELADNLAGELWSWSGEVPEVGDADGTLGIWFGLFKDWRPAGFCGLAHFPDWLEYQNTYAFGLDEESGATLVMGSDIRCLTKALYAFLETCGIVTLTPTWDTKPLCPVSLEAAELQVETTRPHLFLQGIGSGGGMLQSQRPRLDRWRLRNGIIDQVRIDYGHAWGRLRQEKTLDPLWLAGDGEGNKLCCYEPGLIATAKEWVEERAATGLDYVSLAASDGDLGWDSDCFNGETDTRSESDRQAHLLNSVQAQVSFPLVGHIYGRTVPAPTIELDPRILWVLCTAYTGGVDPDEAWALYQEKGAQLMAPYSYLTVWPWDRDAPGRAPIVSSRLQEEMDRAYSALGFLTECGQGWAPWGPLYYAIPRWLDSEALDLDQFAQEFIALAFPIAIEEAEAFYDLCWEPSLLTTDLVHRLANAAGELLAADGSSRARDLGLYVMYVDLLRRYEADPGAATLEPLLRHCSAIADLDLVSYNILFYDPLLAAHREQIAASYGLTTLNPYAPPWDVPLVPDITAMQGILTDIAENNPALPFPTVSYGGELKEAPLSPAQALLTYSYMSRNGAMSFLAQSEAPSISIEAGWATNKGDSKIVAIDYLSGQVLGELSCAPDHVVRWLPISCAPGTQITVQITAAGGCRVGVEADTPHVFTADDAKALFLGNYRGYFYVPPGCTLIGGYTHAATLKFYTHDGVLRSGQMLAKSIFQVTVPAGYDGTVWKFDGANTAMALYTVPRQWALQPNLLLVPKELP